MTRHLHTTLENVRQELEHIEKQIKKINDALCIEQLQKQNDYLLSELHTMLAEYTLEKDLTAQKVSSKIRRILYKVTETVDHREKRAI